MSGNKKTGEFVGLVIIAIIFAILMFVTGFAVAEKISSPETSCPEQVCPTCTAATCEKCPECPQAIQDIMIVECGKCEKCEKKVEKPRSRKVDFQYHACNPGEANSFSGICDGKKITQGGLFK